MPSFGGVRRDERLLQGRVDAAREERVEPAAGVDLQRPLDGLAVRRQPLLERERRLPVVLADRDVDDVERHGHRGAEKHVPDTREDHHFDSPPPTCHRVPELEAARSDVHAVDGLADLLALEERLQRVVAGRDGHREGAVAIRHRELDRVGIDDDVHGDARKELVANHVQTRRSSPPTRAVEPGAVGFGAHLSLPTS